EQAPPPGVVDTELLEHGARRLAPLLGAGPPFGGQLGAQLEIALRRLEDPPDDQLRRGRAVPRVGLEPEGEVVGTDPPPAVERRAEPEGDRAAGCPSRLDGTEAQVLPLPHRL